MTDRLGSSTTSHLSTLFNWNPRNCVGQKGKCGVKRRRSPPVWTHTFVCLSNRNADMIPSGSDRAQLQIAGLGEKRLSFNLDSSPHDFYREIVSYFPKLSTGGGFELLRCTNPRQSLEIISAPSHGYSASFLKAVVQQAKIYIRPLQRDLPYTPYEGEVSKYRLNYN